MRKRQIKKYERQIILPIIGCEGQEKILKAKVLIVGLGGIGSPCALYLAAAGVGTIGIVDADNVELSNLQRQIIHFSPDVGKPKVISAKEKIEKINPDVKVITHAVRARAGNIAQIIKDYDFIIDGTDNFASKFLINDACVFAAKPFSHGGVLRFSGQTMTYTPGNACYRCIFAGPPPRDAVPSCSQAGILGAVAGMLGTIQATEALKCLIGKGELLVNRLLIFDALNMKFRETAVKRNPHCPLCGENPSIKELIDEEQPACDLKDKANHENKKTNC